MSYRVAITSSDGEHIDQHFGQASEFYIFEIDEGIGNREYIETRKTVETAAGDDLQPRGHSDTYLISVGELLSDCTYLLTEKIGIRPYRALQQKGINSLESPRDLATAITKLNSYRMNKRKGSVM